jgi:CubicO group peptidase (beta-lactamase class C family)
MPDPAALPPQEALFQRIRAVLNDEWKPIGDGVPADEYDTYVGGVLSMIAEGTASEDAVADYLRAVVEQQIGLDDDRARTAAVAIAIMQAAREIPLSSPQPPADRLAPRWNTTPRTPSTARLHGYDLDAACAAAEEAVAPWRTQAGPGGAVVIFDMLGVQAELCGGLASIEHGLPFTPDTVNRWASITKHAFAALLLRQGRIGLADRLGRHLPGLSAPVAAITAGQALDMTSGLPDLGELIGCMGLSPTTAMDRHALLAFAARLPALNHPPGHEISYTNTGYRLLQAAMEQDGVPLAEAWRRWLFGPLAHDIHFPEDFPVPLPGLAGGYWHDGAGWRGGQYGLHLSASGGLAGSARALAAWLMALLRNTGELAGLLARLAPSRHFADGRATGYGLGIAHAAGLGQECFGHGGSLPGYKDHFLLAPGAGMGVVVLSNREDTDALGMALAVMAAALGARLPPAAPDLLPEGVFADAAGGPFWIEHAGGQLTFLGAQERLFDAGGGIAAGRSPYMAMALARAGDGIAGTINGVRRRFAPVAPDIPADPAWAGTWRDPIFGTVIEVAVAGDGARLALGVGATRRDIALQPLGGGRALGAWLDGPTRRRVCFVFDGDGLRVITNRARILELSRA